MAQLNVRGQKLIDAIVQVFHDAQGQRSLTAGEVARRVRAAGFWGGKEPKAADQMVASYLEIRHAGMFEPGPDATFALRSAFRRGAAALAPAAAAPRPEPIELRPLTPPSLPAATPQPVSQVGKRKKRKSFGGAAVACVTPAADAQVLPPSVNLHLSFEEAMKLHLSLGHLLGQLSRRGGPSSAARPEVAAAKIRVDFARRRVSLFKRKLKR